MRRLIRRPALALAPVVLLTALGLLPCHWAVPVPASTVAAQTQPVQDVRISLTEWALSPSRVTVPLGRTIRFLAANDGILPHVLAVEGHGLYAETDGIGSGDVAALTVTFTVPGIYDLFCPVNAGQHRELGQEGVLVVSPFTAGLLLPRTGAPSTPGDAVAVEAE